MALQDLLTEVQNLTYTCEGVWNGVLFWVMPTTFEYPFEFSEKKLSTKSTFTDHITKGIERYPMVIRFDGIGYYQRYTMFKQMANEKQIGVLFVRKYTQAYPYVGIASLKEIISEFDFHIDVEVEFRQLKTGDVIISGANAENTTENGSIFTQAKTFLKDLTGWFD
ncbi:Uncharacterised protein [Sebaldella termitidis]|uniref:Uncharacterized protein n=1 Tax=Sebaldella termitidis (strain ATCC 33386 / NCTC 11300) TaxID=526218 RepID=D1AN65_SEBTE|nr:hypothetical protein [Sebaldella termitidis]ACZ09669.1 hypothetical protein Sterm_2825 [Sebaldella termitidis ATCC 33386]SUI25001.1 Uncharacterised protein [Sebaldella termitidis]